MSRWAAVLFDLDGTLADTVDLIVHCFRHTMSVHLDEVPHDQAWLSTIGRPLRDQLRDFATDADEVEAMANTYATYQRTIHDQMVEAFPGAVEVVEALVLRGTRVGVVTSKRRRMALRTLAVCGLEDAFEVLVCADDVTRGKPDPEPVRLALKELGLTDRAGDILFVGDAPYDIQSGNAAGVRTAAVAWGTYPREVLVEAGPDLWLSALSDVLDHA